MELVKLLEEVQHHSRQGNRKMLQQTLREIIPERLQLYKTCQQLIRLEEYVDILYKSLLLQLDNEEEESIEMAELAYIGITEEVTRSREKLYENLRTRITIMHYFADYLTDSLIEVFLKKYRETNLLEARNLALESIAKMQLADIFYLEQHFNTQMDQDEQLNDICNTIEISPNLSEAELAEAQLMHKVLYTYLRIKYKQKLEKP